MKVNKEKKQRKKKKNKCQVVINAMKRNKREKDDWEFRVG